MMPSYIRIEGVWYVRKDHYGEQLGIAIRSAFIDGLVQAGSPPAKRSKRGTYRPKVKAMEPAE
jgi:hypothetical protein